MAAFFGKGTKLDVDTTGAGAWATIVEAKTIAGPSFEAEEVDITNHDTAGPYRAYLRGLVDPGEITAEINWDPSETSHDRLLTDLVSGEIRPYRIQWLPMDPTDYELEFSAFVKSLPITSPVDNVVIANLTLRVTGAVTLSTV